MSPNPTDAELLEQISRAIDRLPEPRRTIMLLNRVEGQSYLEIAHACGISVWRVRRHIRAAVLALDRAVGDRERTPWSCPLAAMSAEDI